MESVDVSSTPTLPLLSFSSTCLAFDVTSPQKLKLPPPPSLEPREKTCWQCGQTFHTTSDVCPNDGSRLIDLTIDDSHDPFLGQTIGDRYKVNKRLGSGGMGHVYEARDLREPRDVAIKVLKLDYLRDDNIRRRFMHEARIIANLEHPNSVQLYDFGQTPDGNFFMVMELLEGESLADRLSHKFLTYREIFNLIPPICDALAEAHDNGVVHRDLKPENIFIVMDGEREEPRLIDFGVARQLERKTITRTGTLWGTPAYMSPEQARGDSVEAAADVYSIGVILYELICGHLPFHAENQMGYAVKHMHHRARPMKSAPGLTSPPDELDAFVLAALEKRPEQRPDDMRDFAATLRDIIDRHMSEQLLERTPALEVDAVALQEWIKQGEENREVVDSPASYFPGEVSFGADSSGERSSDSRPRPLVATLDISEAELDVQSFGAGARLAAAPKWALPAAALFLVCVILGVVWASSGPEPEPLEITEAPGAASTTPATPDAPTALGDAEASGTGEAAGLAASRAVHVMMRAQRVATVEPRPTARPEPSSSRSSKRASKKRGTSARKSTRAKPKKNPRVKREDMKDALRNTF